MSHHLVKGQEVGASGNFQYFNAPPFIIGFSGSKVAEDYVMVQPITITMFPAAWTQASS